jgi:hypothetical protein
MRPRELDFTGPPRLRGTGRLQRRLYVALTLAAASSVTPGSSKPPADS